LTLLLMAYLFGLQLFARQLCPTSGSHVWEVSMQSLQSNLSRPRAFLAIALSFGLPGLLAVWLTVARKQVLWRRAAVTVPLLAGLATSLALTAYAVLSAYADGRFIWTSYPFTIPLGMVLLSEWTSQEWRDE
jgi:hypothetical protein